MFYYILVIVMVMYIADISVHPMKINENYKIIFFFTFIWPNSPQLTRFLDHTQRRATVGRTPVDE